MLQPSLQSQTYYCEYGNNFTEERDHAVRKTVKTHFTIMAIGYNVPLNYPAAEQCYCCLGHLQCAVQIAKYTNVGYSLKYRHSMKISITSACEKMNILVS